MTDAKSVRRALLLTTVLAACAAAPATARVADATGNRTAVAAQAQTHGVPARVDGIGVQPPRRTNVTAVAITRPSQRHGFDWPSAAIAVVVVLSLALVGFAGWSTRRAARATRA
jgi:hypothetical protein